MGLKFIFTPRRIKACKIALMLSAFILWVYSSARPEMRAHDPNVSLAAWVFWCKCIAYYCAVVTGLVMLEYWQDRLLRLIASTAFLACINNLLDELFFDPLTFQMGEVVFGVLIACNFVYQLTRILKYGISKP